MKHRKRALWALPLALAVLATACGGDDSEGSTSTTAGTATTSTGAAASGDVSLKGVCPDNIVIQTDWFPEAEHGALYQMVGDNPTIDASKKIVKGPLVASGGKDTGVTIEIRTGGPAIGFQTVASQLKADPNILLGYMATDEAIENYADIPTKAIVAPLDINPQIIMWDPGTYPDVRTIADLGKANVTIRYFETGAYMRFLVNSGQVHQSQLDGSYDGSPAVFTAQGGKIAQQGFASAEPYTYEHLVPEWNKPVSYQLIHDAGWKPYAAPLAVAQNKFDKYKSCFAKLVPIVQQAQVDYITNPAETNTLIVDAVQKYKDFWVYSEDLADYSVKTQLELGLVGNGPDDTLGNFDEARLTDFIGKALPVFAAKNPPANLKWSDLMTNEFIDSSIGLKYVRARPTGPGPTIADGRGDTAGDTRGEVRGEVRGDVRGDVDVVVVGAGHNGLVCAAYLARAGVRTRVVEARDTVGGCASTVDALGARVNICNCDHVAVRSLPLAEELDLEAHGLRYLDLDPMQVCLSWSADQPAVLFHDVERTLHTLDVTHPDQVEGYRAYLRAALPVARLVLDLAGAAPTPGQALGRAARRRLRGVGTLTRWSRRSVAEVLRGFFSSETLLGSAVATGPAVWGVSPHLPGTGLGALRLALTHAVAPGRPVGGSGALTDALRAAVEAAGGTVTCGRPVDRLLVEGDRLRGVRLADGEEVLARTVVVACDPRVAVLEWLSEPPPAALAALAGAWRDRPALDGYESKVDALVRTAPRLVDLDDGLLRRLGDPDPLVPTVVVAPTVDGIAAAHRAAAEGRVAERPIFLVNVPSVADPTMAGPDGTHVLSLEALFTPYALAGGWPGSAEPQRWLETFAAKAGDGFLEGVVAVRAMTPDRYEEEFSMPRGYAPSFAGGPLAALLGRDPELSRYRTPLAGLYLTGAATFPGAGIWGASGRNTAGVVLGDLDRPT